MKEESQKKQLFFCTGVGNGASGLYKMPKNTVLVTKFTHLFISLFFLRRRPFLFSTVSLC